MTPERIERVKRLLEWFESNCTIEPPPQQEVAEALRALLAEWEEQRKRIKAILRDADLNRQAWKGTIVRADKAEVLAEERGRDIKERDRVIRDHKDALKERGREIERLKAHADERAHDWAAACDRAEQAEARLAIAGAAIQTYIEVRQLRKDVDRLEQYIINIIEETVK